MADHKTRQTARIVQAALVVIHREGLTGVSMSKVAAEAGVTRQTVYNYFPDPESIVARAIEDHTAAVEQQLLDSMRQATGSFGQLKAVTDQLIANTTPEHANLDLESGLSAEIRPRIAAHRDTVRMAVEQAIASGIESGDFDNGLEPRVVAALVLGIAHGAASAAAEHPDRKPFLRDAAARAVWVVVAPDPKAG